MVEAKKNELANALKEVKIVCKEFGFTAGMLKGELTEGRRKPIKRSQIVTSASCCKNELKKPIHVVN